jgi:hypothetical protein
MLAVVWPLVPGRETACMPLATPRQGLIGLNYDDFRNVANCEAVF